MVENLPQEEQLRALLSAGSVAVLTGAGMSTDSGIPDYRGPGSPRATPMLYAEFTGSAANRRRYWARAYRGWLQMGRAQPNAGHRALAALKRTGLIDGVITQNVDGLHEAAGSINVVALHGRISAVVCLDCGHRSGRARLQQRLTELNPTATAPDELIGNRQAHAELRPDGDAVVDDWADFIVADCLACGGVLKPDVVFFGETVPKGRVARSFELVDSARTLVVLGSSLTVMSGLRFVRRAAKDGKPVIVVNRGRTRGDDLATLKIDMGCSKFLAGWGSRASVDEPAAPGTVSARR